MEIPLRVSPLIPGISHGIFPNLEEGKLNLPRPVHKVSQAGFVTRHKQNSLLPGPKLLTATDNLRLLLRSHIHFHEVFMFTEK